MSNYPDDGNIPDYASPDDGRIQPADFRGPGFDQAKMPPEAQNDTFSPESDPSGTSSSPSKKKNWKKPPVSL